MDGRGDPHDLVYCIEYGPGGWEARLAFRGQLRGNTAAVRQSVDILRKHFLGDDKIEAHLRTGLRWLPISG